jgi:hypothetical protein
MQLPCPHGRPGFTIYGTTAARRDGHHYLHFYFFERLIAILALAFIFDHECVCSVHGWDSPRNFWNLVRWLAPIIPAITAIATILLHLLSVLEYDKRIAYS